MFDPNGKFVRTLGSFHVVKAKSGKGSQSVGHGIDILFPADIDSRGQWLLVPDLHARVTILDGIFVAEWVVGGRVTKRVKVLATAQTRDRIIRPAESLDIGFHSNSVSGRR